METQEIVKFEPYIHQKPEKDMVDLARCLVMANNNSPITLQIKNVTTLGRHCTEFLKWSKFKDYDFYE